MPVEGNHTASDFLREASEDFAVQSLTQIRVLVGEVVLGHILHALKHGVLLCETVHQNKEHTDTGLLDRSCLYLLAIGELELDNIADLELIGVYLDGSLDFHSISSLI